MENRGQCFGIDFTQLDANLSVDKQIADIDMLVSKKCDAIVFYPLDPKALGPALQRAKAAGVKLFAIAYNMKEFDDPEAYGPVITEIIERGYVSSRGTAHYIGKRTGGKGNLLVVTIGVPVPSIRIQTDMFLDELKEYPGIKVLEEIGNPDDQASGARPLVENMINKYKGKIDVIWCYNDPTAIGAYGAVQAAGLKNVIITGMNADEMGIEALRKGMIEITWDINPPIIGKLMIEAVYDVLSGRKQIYEMPRGIVAPETMYEKKDVDKYLPWPVRAEQLKDCTLPDGVIEFKK
jgi:ribose transport system substrate-binding protein